MSKRTMMILAMSLGVLALLGVACAACINLRDPYPYLRSPDGVERGDCDAEDYRNREDDCGFTESDRLKLKSPTPRTVKPTPKVTRR